MSSLRGSILYFAYRADIRRENLLKHFPDAVWLGLAKLEDYRLAFEAQGVGTLRQQVGTVLFGGLWLVPASELALLDEIGGVASGQSHRITHGIVSPAGPRAEAMMYVGSGTGSAGMPSPGYLEEMIIGAQENQAPESYINSLRTLGGKFDASAPVAAAVVAP